MSIRHWLASVAVGLLLTACNYDLSIEPDAIEVVSMPEQVYNDHYQEVRLADGVPLRLQMYVRYDIEEPWAFRREFPSVDTFNRLILYPRILELSKEVANTFGRVDSVFHGQRQQFIDAIKETLLTRIDEPGLVIKQVTVADIGFPQLLTDAMEQVALQHQELKRIARQNEIAIATSDALRQKTEADGKVAIAQAEAAGRLQAIQAQTEEKRRRIELARAETAAAVSRKQAQAEADRQRLLAQAAAEEKRDLQKIELEKQRQLDVIELERQVQLADMYNKNPVYATMVVNRELAANVEIAVLPSSADGGIFSGFMQQQLTGMKKD